VGADRAVSRQRRGGALDADPFALFSFLAVFAIARRLGLGRRDAAFASVLYAAIPHVFPVLAVMAGNDHSTAFFTLAGSTPAWPAPGAPAPARPC